MNTSSFSTDIKNIATGKGSVASKVDAIVKMGVPYNEARFVVKLYSEPTPSRPRVSTIKFTFGVELEMFNANRTEVRAALNNSGVRFNYEGYNHIDNARYYKFVSDSSISGNDPIECVSPVLKSSNGFSSLKTTVAALNEAGCQVNRSTGFHVHIGAEDLTDQEYCNVFVNYMYLESVIDSFMAASRRGNSSHWCRTLIDHKDELLACHTKDGIKRALNWDRYHKVNAESYSRHKTIEFRQHQGTINYEKIEMWIKFCGKLVEWSKTHRLDHFVESIDEIEFLNRNEKAFFKGRIASLAA